jgi:outer membrane protein assembly factor BamE (lipoprotein component of BamABCDE complex)
MTAGSRGNGHAQERTGVERMQGTGRMMRTVAAAALLTALAGCVSIKDHRGYIMDTAVADSIQPGVDNKTSVERALGRPTFASQYGDPVWYYTSTSTRQRPFAASRAYDQTVLRIRFDAQGNVAAVDKAGIDKVVHISPDGKKTPTLGRDRGLLEDLFGNIGTVGSGLGGPGGGGSTGGPNGS